MATDIRLHSLAELGEFFPRPGLEAELVAPAIQRLERRGTGRSLLNAGELALQAAADMADSATGQAFFDQAESLLGTALERAGQEQSLGVKGPARAWLACLPYYRQLLFGGALLNSGAVTESYEALLEAADSQVKDLITAERLRLTDDRMDGTCHHIVGDLSEMVITLILQRDGIKSEAGTGWGSVLALPHEDGHDFTPVRSHWDVSVYTHYDQAAEPELTYKAQVKSGECDHVPVNEDIALISVTRHLALDGSTYAGPKQLTRELIDDSNGNKTAAARLDRRAIQLIDKLDEAKPKR